jgi:4-diphosphocytidyl-2-C-methyl-D-erythritol kinase
VHAPAKINLTLAVLGGPRPDGYHALRGVFARLELADELAITEQASPTGRAAEKVRLAPGSLPLELPAEPSGDLIRRAAGLLRAWADRPLPAITLELVKRVPVAAGLAGGSSDGAAGLRLLAATWGLAITPDELVSMALELGADVPFFLGAAPVAVVSGRGETVEPLPAALAGTGVLIVDTGGKPSTGDVFRAYDERRPSGNRASDTEANGSMATARLAAAIRGGATPTSLAELATELREGNDLYPAAATIIPHLADTRAWLDDVLARPALLSGAGSALFLLYPSRSDAEEAERRVADAVGGRPRRIPQPTLIATAIAAR